MCQFLFRVPTPIDSNFINWQVHLNIVVLVDAIYKLSLNDLQNFTVDRFLQLRYTLNVDGLDVVSHDSILRDGYAYSSDRIYSLIYSIDWLMFFSLIVSK